MDSHGGFAAKAIRDYQAEHPELFLVRHRSGLAK
ncbi:hypothetical protein QFZ40_003635 [Arthrobacter pascens]|nr:hypothetical protein [Arthrobacter pascens]